MILPWCIPRLELLLLHGPPIQVVHQRQPLRPQGLDDQLQLLTGVEVQPSLPGISRDKLGREGKHALRFEPARDPPEQTKLLPNNTPVQPHSGPALHAVHVLETRNTIDGVARCEPLPSQQAPETPGLQVEVLDGDGMDLRCWAESRWCGLESAGVPGLPVPPFE